MYPIGQYRRLRDPPCASYFDGTLESSPRVKPAEDVVGLSFDVYEDGQALRAVSRPRRCRRASHRQYGSHSEVETALA